METVHELRRLLLRYMRVDVIYRFRHLLLILGNMQTSLDLALHRCGNYSITEGSEMTDWRGIGRDTTVCHDGRRHEGLKNNKNLKDSLRFDSSNGCCLPPVKSSTKPRTVPKDKRMSRDTISWFLRQSTSTYVKGDRFGYWKWSVCARVQGAVVWPTNVRVSYEVTSSLDKESLKFGLFMPTHSSRSIRWPK